MILPVVVRFPCLISHNYKQAFDIGSCKKMSEDMGLVSLWTTDSAIKDKQQPDCVTLTPPSREMLDSANSAFKKCKKHMELLKCKTFWN